MRDQPPLADTAVTNGYRPDIDGMRALAVGLVLFHHVGYESVPGGYIGVDVFFVISGYLITSIIFPKIATRKFSFTEFFSRRVKRLSPVLAVVVLSTIVAACLVLLPTDLVNLAGSAMYVAFFVGNIFFWRNYGGYFAEDAQSAPLLHTWSLAVEEQYYLLWPISLLISLRLLGARNTIIVTCLALPALVYLSQLGTEMTIGAAYYLLPTRFFELLAGSATAMIRLPSRLKLGKGLATGLGFVGVALILYASVQLSPASTFPGYNALWPVIGTLCLIMSASGGVNSLFALRPIVYLGKLSYSLYLWHWPVIAFMHYSGREFDDAERVGALLVALSLSVLSFHIIENPLRRRSFQSHGRVFLFLYGLPTLVIAMFALLIHQTNGFPSRFDDETVQADKAIASKVHEQRPSCHAPARLWARTPSPDCLFGADSAGPVAALLIGDSHANHLVPFLGRMLADVGSKGTDYTMDRCPPIADLDYGANPIMARQCGQRNSFAVDLLNNNQFQYVVMAASWPNSKTTSVHIKGTRVSDAAEVERLLSAALESTVQMIVGSSAVPIIVRETPTLTHVSPRCPLQVKTFGADLRCEGRLFRNDWLDRLIPELQKKYPSLTVIEPSKLICDEADTCQMSLNGLPLYSDDNHLNAAGSKALGAAYVSRYGNPFGTDISRLTRQ